MLSLDRSTTMKGGTSSSSWNEYERKSHSTISLPAQRTEYLRRLSTLSDEFPLFASDMALPVHEEAVLDTDVDEAIQGDGDDINCVPVTPAFLLSTKYQRRYYQ